MGDLTIPKRLAKIEGLTFYVQFDTVRILVPDGDDYYFDPENDDALCFKLMVKYKVEFMPSWEKVRSDGRKKYGSYCVDGDRLVLRSDSPNKSICLAIIEANKDKS